MASRCSHAVVLGRCSCGRKFAFVLTLLQQRLQGHHDGRTSCCVRLTTGRRELGAPRAARKASRSSTSYAKAGRTLDEIMRRLTGGPSLWTGEALDGELVGVPGAHNHCANDVRTGTSDVPGVEVRAAGAYVIYRPDQARLQGCLWMAGRSAAVGRRPRASPACNARAEVRRARAAPARSRGRHHRRRAGTTAREPCRLDAPARDGRARDRARCSWRWNTDRCGPPAREDEGSCKVAASIARVSLRRPFNCGRGPQLSCVARDEGQQARGRTPRTTRRLQPARALLVA